MNDARVRSENDLKEADQEKKTAESGIKRSVPTGRFSF